MTNYVIGIMNLLRRSTEPCVRVHMRMYVESNYMYEGYINMALLNILQKCWNVAV